MASKSGDYDAVREDIKKLLKQPEYDDGSAGPVLVRLAWYALDPPHSGFPVTIPILRLKTLQQPSSRGSRFPECR